jgi:F0F1-type ATP synthase membrane subunit c/vacuolar-type H+-ATPase subunit K
VRRVAILTIVGAIVGVLLALLINAVQNPKSCTSTTKALSGSCDTRPALGGLIVGVGACGAGIGIFCGMAWEAEARRRDAEQ